MVLQYSFQYEHPFDRMAERSVRRWRYKRGLPPLMRLRFRAWASPSDYLISSPDVAA